MAATGDVSSLMVHPLDVPTRVADGSPMAGRGRFFLPNRLAIRLGRRTTVLPQDND